MNIQVFLSYAVSLYDDATPTSIYVINLTKWASATDFSMSLKNIPAVSFHVYSQALQEHCQEKPPITSLTGPLVQSLSWNCFRMH